MRPVLEESVMRLRNWVAIWIGQILVQRFDRVILQKGHLTLAQRPGIRQRQLGSEVGRDAVDGVLDSTANQFSEINGKICFCSQKGAKRRGARKRVF